MDKREVIAAMQKQCNGASFITKGELAKCLKYGDPKNVAKYLRGLDCINGTRYFIPDVVNRLFEYRVFK